MEPEKTDDAESDYEESGGVHVVRRRSQRCITVEPAVFFFMLAYTTSITVRVQYVQYAVSLSHGVTPSFSPTGGGFVQQNGTCEELNHSDPEYERENTIQSESSYWILYFDVVSYALSIFTAPLIGSYSDKAGRKIACMVPCGGLSIYCAVYLTVISLNLPLEYLFIAEAMRGATGNFFTALSGFFAFIADVTTKQQRTYRIVIVQFLTIFAASFSQVGIGFLIAKQGFGLPFMLALILIVLTVLYTIFLTQETIIYDPNQRFHMMEQLRDIRNLFKDNTQGRRWRLIAIFSNNIIITLVVNSALGLTVLYVTAYPFCWSTILIGFYVGTTLLFNALGMVVGGKLLSCCLSDLGMIQAAIVSYIASLLLVAFAFTPAIMFIAAVVGAISFLAIPIFRAKISKIVRESEQGTAFATAGCFESIGMCFSPVIFNTIYAETVDELPGLVFLTMACLLVVAIVITAVLQIKEPKQGYIPLPGRDLNADGDEKPIIN
ncbi:proton-coupled folate transporter-like [Ptychodera flava]|uniref:proton-coupled folate transporter-like n=1 Tax=Ptychodera flava TaxID=63121 RepID=UPI00396AA5EF